MILYQGTVKEFSDSIEANQLIPQLESVFKEKLGRSLPPNEIGAYTNSLSFMERVVRRSSIPEDCGVLVEYMIPLTSNRIDFLVAGEDENGNKNFIIVELKQWQEAYPTSSDGVVETYLNGGIRETAHPSYQAHSYKLFMSDFNEEISGGNISAYACAYLHNYQEHHPEPLTGAPYIEIVDEAPIYFRDDQEKLEQFFSKYLKGGNGSDILYKLDHGRIKPTKKLIDHLAGLFKGNHEFVLLDEQKVAFEKARKIANNEKEKSVVIVKGGPGTGKSVISVNLLGQLLKDELNTIFVAPNAAFRDVMVDRLVQENNRTRVKNLFKGSSSFYDADPNTFDVLVVDEAHRLKKKGAFMYRGENQVEDIVRASKVSIFFIDDNQAVRPEDIGSVKEIKRIADKYNAPVSEIELTAQFRCAGAEGYINWITNTLQLEETANYDGWETEEYDFQIFDDPNALVDVINMKHIQGHNARVLAGYAWQWSGAKQGNTDADVDDIVIPEFGFGMPWNSRKVGSTWAVNDEGINQVGCIHTSQGLEFDYVGVIVGNDLSFDPETYTYKTEFEEYKDSQGKRGLKNDPEKLNLLVRRIYKILMSRGAKGCYVYFRDKGVEEHFRERLHS